MTTAYCLTKSQAIFFKTTSSLLKLVNRSMHEGETWYTCIIHRFHDNHNNKSPRALCFLHSSNLLTVARIEVEPGVDVYYIVSMTTTTNSLRHFKKNLLLHSSNLLTVDMHGGETWCTCVLHRFRDEQKAWGTFTSSLQKLVKGSTHGDETWYTCVLHHFHDNYMFLWRLHIVKIVSHTSPQNYGMHAC